MHWARYVYRVEVYHKKSFQCLTTRFTSNWWEDCNNMQEIILPQWLFECRPRQDKKVLANGLDWMSYRAGSQSWFLNYFIIFIAIPSSSGLGKHCWTDLLWYSKHSINIPYEAQRCIFSNISSKTPEEWCSQVAHIPLKIFQCTEKRLFHFEICMHNPSCWLGYWVGVWLGRICEFFSTL